MHSLGKAGVPEVYRFILKSLFDVTGYNAPGNDGLKNHGNSCFMATALQNLASAATFAEFPPGPPHTVGEDVSTTLLRILSTLRGSGHRGSKDDSVQRDFCICVNTLRSSCIFTDLATPSTTRSCSSAITFREVPIPACWIR